MIYTKKITLKNGIVIEDSRSIQCGVLIKNQKTDYAVLTYKEDRFYCFVWSGHYSQKELQVLQKEIQEINECINEINEIYGSDFVYTPKAGSHSTHEGQP